MVGREDGQAMLESVIVLACAALGIGLALAAAGNGIFAKTDALGWFYRMPFP